MTKEHRMRIHRWASREGTRGIRAFAHLHGRKRRDLAEARVEVYVASGASHTGFAISTDGDGHPQLFVGLHKIACAWLTIGSPALAGAAYRRWKRSIPYDLDAISVRIHDGAIWWNLWVDTMGGRKRLPKWRDGCFNPADRILGRHAHTATVIEGPTRVEIPMPERTYPAMVTIERRRWKRPRWPWANEVYGYDVEMLKTDDAPGYIPEPGKGENSWDIGPDGMFSMSGAGDGTIEDAIAHVVRTALATRRRRGAAPDYAEQIA